MDLTLNFQKVKNFLTKNQNKKFNIFIILSVLAMILEILSISLIVPLINIFVQGEVNIPYFDLDYSYESLILILLSVFVLVFTLKNIFLVFFERMKFKFLYELKTNVSEKIFKNYINKDFLFHLKNNSSILIRNINDISHIQAVIRSWIIFFSEILIVLGITIFLLFYDPYITIIAILFLSILGFIFYTNVQKKAKKWGKERQIHDGQRLKKLSESFGAIKDIKLLGKEDYFLDKFSYHNSNSAISEFYNNFVLALPRLIFEWLLVVCVVLLVFFIIKQGQGLDYALSILSLFIVAAFRFMPSITRIMNALQIIKYSGHALDKVSTNIKDLHFNKLINKETNDNKLVFKNKIEIKNISFSFNEEKNKILSNLSCIINSGEKIGIIGESGTGKTTLINLIIGLLPPLEGKIIVDDQDISFNLHKWQNIIGYVPQNIFLLDDTLLKNIALGVEENEINNDKINSLIKLTKLTKLVNQSKKKLDVNVGELGSKISGGERQRLGIARALYKDPKILILDESTSALDIETEQEIINDIHNIMRDKTMIVISHRKSTLNKCDVIFQLDAQGIKKYG